MPIGSPFCAPYLKVRYRNKSDSSRFTGLITMIPSGVSSLTRNQEHELISFVAGSEYNITFSRFVPSVVFSDGEGRAGFVQRQKLIVRFEKSVFFYLFFSYVARTLYK